MSPTASNSLPHPVPEPEQAGQVSFLYRAKLIGRDHELRLLRDVVLTGNVFQTLADIEAIGDDLKMHGGLGGCGKGGQSPLRVSDGGPSVRIKNVVVGGL